MPKVITQDDIDKIAEYAGRSYTKAAVARELGLDRTTVRKYWPREQKPEEEKAKQPTPQLSLEEDFDLRTKKKETELKLENLQIKLEDTDGETQDLEARREVALEQIKVLGEKLDEAESVIEVDKV
jgi:transposase-like protein